MRVLQVVPSLVVGGAERVATELSESLQALGHEVALVSLAGPQGSVLEEQLDDLGVPVHFLGKGPGFEAGPILRLKGILRRWRPDVVHTHLHVLKYVLPASVSRRRPAIVHTMHNLAEREAEAADLRLQQQVFGRLVEPVAIGEAVAESMVELYGSRPRHTVPNGIPMARFEAPAGTRERLRAELGLSAEARVLLAVGRLNAQKDHATLLRALAILAEDLDPPVLLVAGEGDLRPELEALREQLGLGEGARLLGLRRDVPELLAACDLFVMSSTYEGNPLSVMEALAAGRPVVSTAVGCVPELVDETVGRLVAPSDPAELAGAIEALCGDPELLDALGRAAHRRAAERFSSEGMARSYVRVYESLLSGRRQTSPKR